LFLTQLSKRENAMPDRELTLVPFRFRIGPNSESLGFEIRYNGPRPIKLVQVWAELPWTLMDPNWSRAGVTGHLVSEPVHVGGATYLRREYIASTNTPDIRESVAGWKPLHPHLATKFCTF